MKLNGFVLALALLATPITTQSQEREQKTTTGGDGRFIIIPKAGGSDWALLLDTRTGDTWRLGNLKVPNPDYPTGTEETIRSVVVPRTKTRWFWAPIEVCDTCR